LIQTRLETSDRRFDFKLNLDESTTTYSKNAFSNVLAGYKEGQ